MKLIRLEWDSEFWSKDYYNLDLEDLDISEELPKGNNIFIQGLVDICNSEGIKYLERNNFNFQDLKIDYELKLSYKQTAKLLVENIASQEDIPFINDIARSVFFKESRFSCEYFNQEKIRQFYSLWAGKAVLGRFDEECIVERRNGKPVGFVSYRKSGNNIIIGLLGILKRYHGSGIGKSLLNKLIIRATEKKGEIVTVSTEGKNMNAQRFYIRNRFFPSRISMWYYK